MTLGEILRFENSSSEAPAQIHPYAGSPLRRFTLAQVTSSWPRSFFNSQSCLMVSIRPTWYALGSCPAGTPSREAKIKHSDCSALLAAQEAACLGHCYMQ